MRLDFGKMLVFLLAATLAAAAGCGFSSEDKKNEDAGRDTLSDHPATYQDVSRDVGLMCNDAACDSCPAIAPLPGDLCTEDGQSCNYWDPNPVDPFKKNPGCHCVPGDAGISSWNCTYVL